MLPPVDISGPMLKIARAEYHIQEFTAATKAFFESKPYSIVHERDPNGAGYKVKLRLQRPLPEHLPLIVGEALYQMRSALDVFISCCAKADGATNTADVYFPFAGSETEFNSAAPQRKIRKLAPARQDYIRALQPYPGGNTLLWAVNALANIDRHNCLVAVGGLNRVKEIKLTGGQYFIPDPERLQWLENDVVLIVGITGTPPEGHFDLAVGVAFREGPVVKDRPVAPVLNDCLDAVGKVVRMFEPTAASLNG